jgi:hypothetical protein
MSGERGTDTTDVPARTVAASRARRVKATQRMALTLATRLVLLDDEWLCELARVVMHEVSIRETQQATTAAAQQDGGGS